MAGRGAERLRLPQKVRKQVSRLSRSATAPHRLVERAKIIVLACEGHSNAEIARRLQCSESTVRKWRGRMQDRPKQASLDDMPRSGRPAEIPISIRCEVIKQACDRPAESTFRQIWSLETLSDRVAEHTGWQLSRSEVWRILQCEGIRPHHVRMWLHSPDPKFHEKVSAICALYLEPPPGAAVICVDEKPGMLARERIHPTRYSPTQRAIRYEFEYVRHGTSTLIAAFDTRTGKVFGQCRRRTAPGLVSFMDALAKRYPTGDVYIVWDNLNIHRGPRWKEFNEKHGGRFHFVHTPLHASWVNQVELWFSILQRQILKHSSFCSTEDLERVVLGFIEYWNGEKAHPFRWTFRGGRETSQTLAA